MWQWTAFLFFLLQLLYLNASDSACSVVVYSPSGKTFTSANQLRTVMLCPSEFLRPCGGILFFLLIFWTVCFLLMENLVIYTYVYAFVTVSRHLQTYQSAGTSSLIFVGLTEEQEIQDGTISFQELKENSWRDIASISRQTCCVPRNIFKWCGTCWKAGGHHVKNLLRSGVNWTAGEKWNF